MERLDDIRKSSRVKGVILSIDSPGGTTAGGEAIFNAVRAVAAEKPVVAQVGTLAASAGYMIASASDHIVARQNSIVGSIGVLAQFPNFTGLMDKLGIQPRRGEILAAEGRAFAFQPDDRGRKGDDPLDDPRQLRLVRGHRRGPPQLTARPGSDAWRTARCLPAGRASRGSSSTDSAAKRRLIAWLRTKGVAGNLEVIEWKPTDSGGGLLFSRRARRSGRRGHRATPAPARDILRETGADRLFLDGLVSVWHP